MTFKLAKEIEEKNLYPNLGKFSQLFENKTFIGPCDLESEYPEYFFTDRVIPLVQETQMEFA